MSIGDFNIDKAPQNPLSNPLIFFVNSFGWQLTLDTYNRQFIGSKTTIDNKFTHITKYKIKTNNPVAYLSDHYSPVAEQNSIIFVNSPKQYKLSRQFSENFLETICIVSYGYRCVWNENNMKWNVRPIKNIPISLTAKYSNSLFQLHNMKIIMHDTNNLRIKLSDEVISLKT